ncbi:MAG: hypothetical protein ABIX28_11610 [Vicinamibacterales bacterium]
MHFLEILGSLWPAAETLQPYSLFHYLKTKAILIGAPVPLDDAVLAAVIVVSRPTAPRGRQRVVPRKRQGRGDAERRWEGDTMHPGRVSRRFRCLANEVH